MRPGRILALAAAAMCVAVIVTGTSGWTTWQVIGTSVIGHDDGHGYFARLRGQPFSFLFRIDFDSIADATASSLALLEDGRPLGPAHSPHEDIRKQGAGRYSHWNEPTALYFSSSDRSDPRSNGRRYEATVKVRPAPLAVIAAVVVLATIGWSTRAQMVPLVKRVARKGRAVVARESMISMLALALAASLAWLALVGVAVEKVVPQSRAIHDQASLYRVELPSWQLKWPLSIAFDSSHGPNDSLAELFEDGRRLGPAHTPHDTIRSAGQGRYSHWGNAQTLYFSSSDGSDPRSNGRQYLLRTRAEAPFWLLVPMVALAAFGLYRPIRAMSKAIAPRVRTTLGWVEGLPGRVLAVGLVAAAAATVVSANWNQYYIVPDSASYLPNQFVEPAARPPIVAIWISTFSDSAIVTDHVMAIANAGLYERVNVAGPDDRIAPVIKSQRITLLVAFVVFAIVAIGRMSALGAALGFSGIALGTGPFNAAGWILLLILALVVALCVGFARHARSGTPNPPSASPVAGLDGGLAVALLARATVVAVGIYCFLEPIVRYSYLSEEQQTLLSETLAMSWQLLFAASAIWFIWNGNRYALIFAGVFAGVAYLTRSASVFALLLFAGLVALALLQDWRKTRVVALVAVLVTAGLVYSVPITSAMRTGKAAGSAPMLNWGPIAFALEFAEPGDTALLDGEQSKAFLTAAIALRDSPAANRQPEPPHRSVNLGSNLYNVAHPAAREELKLRKFELMNDYNAEVDRLFGKVARPLLAHHFVEYVGLVAESLAVATGVHPRSTSTRLFRGAWGWLALAALLVVAFLSRLKDWRVGIVAAFLISMHVMHIAVVAAFDIPNPRYVQATEIFVAAAILFLLDSHVRALLGPSKQVEVS